MVWVGFCGESGSPSVCVNSEDHRFQSRLIFKEMSFRCVPLLPFGPSLCVGNVWDELDFVSSRYKESKGGQNYTAFSVITAGH